MPSTDPVWLRQYLTTHPWSHPLTDNDLIPFVFFTLALSALIALTPPTTGWKLVRASIFGLYVSCQVYFCLFVVNPTWETHWGNITGMQWHFVKGLEVMLFYPPEENLFRIRRKEFAIKDGKVEWEDEPVPESRTVKKLYWALDAWFSQRGIGWNYATPLPESSKRQPFTATSTRLAFVLNRLKYLTMMYLINDLARSYMAFGPGAPFFSGRPGIAPPYHSLNITQRALCSLPIAVRVLWSMEEWYVPASILFVVIGGFMGWESSWFSCSGWPPLLGTMRDLWVHPGLSYMWSKTWHQYFHHWLYLFGWHGLGENILRLPRSGISGRPRPPTSKSQAAIPPTPVFNPLTPSRRISPKYFLVNFIKSCIVFALTGLYHDLPSYLVLLRTSEPGSPITLTDCFPTTIFFLLQPLALCVEALVKRYWRIYKAGLYAEKGEPGWLITLERVVGFVWTWWWLGHTSRYFVVGLTRSGVYLRNDRQPVRYSLVGGAIYGKWLH